MCDIKQVREGEIPDDLNYMWYVKKNFWIDSRVSALYGREERIHLVFCSSNA